MKYSELPAFKLFLLLVLFSFLLSLAGLDFLASILLSVFFGVIAFILLKYKFITISYFLLVIAASALISTNYDTLSLEIPNKIIPNQKAIFNGQITDIIKSDNKYIRYFAHGELDFAELPKIKKTGVLLTVIAPKYALFPGDKFIADLEINFPESSMPGNTFDMSTYLKSNEIQWTGISYGRNIFKKSEYDYFSRLSYDLRTSLKKQIFLAFDTTSAQVMTALLTGDKSLISFEMRENFSLSGTAHLLAVSGLHVGIISFIIFTVFSFISNKWLKSFLVIFSLMLFVFMTGFLPSAVRAAIMISVYIFSINFEQKINPLNSLSLAALIMFLINPDIIFSVSFQMSVISVAGILIFYNKIRGLINQFKSKSIIINFITDSISLTLAASILISPVVAYYFGVFSIYSPLANIIVVPIMMIALSIGILAIFASYISIDISDIYAHSVSFLINFANNINEYIISIQYSYIENTDIYLLVLLISASIIYIIYCKELKARIFRTIVSFVIIISVVNIFPNEVQPELEIIPKKNLCALILKSPEKEYLIMLDRKPKNFKKSDFEVQKYIENMNNEFCVFYSGNSGISTIDAAKRKINFKYFEINNDNQMRIINLLKYTNNPVKLIDIR